MEHIKDLSIIVGIAVAILSSLTSIIILVIRVKSAGVAEGKREEFMNTIITKLSGLHSSIDYIERDFPQLLTAKVKEVHERINEVFTIQSNCRSEMGDRVSKIEGKLNDR